MQIIRGLPSPSHKRDCAAVIGNFDGVHLGHQALLRAVSSEAKLRGLASAVVTFEPHPVELFGTHPHARICTLRDKMRLFEACGIDLVFILPFTKRFAALSPEAFARDILAEGLSCRWVTVGSNFQFGSGNAGDIGLLTELGLTYGFEAVATPLVYRDDMRVSSSRIRAAMAVGDLKTAEALLGRPYTVTGRVIHGAALGRTLGFPTLNQAMLPPGSKAVCALHGVFAVRVRGLTDDPACVTAAWRAWATSPRWPTISAGCSRPSSLTTRATPTGASCRSSSSKSCATGKSSRASWNSKRPSTTTRPTPAAFSVSEDKTAPQAQTPAEPLVRRAFD